jgi:hypothetical protein
MTSKTFTVVRRMTVAADSTTDAAKLAYNCMSDPCPDLLPTLEVSEWIDGRPPNHANTPSSEDDDNADAPTPALRHLSIRTLVTSWLSQRVCHKAYDTGTQRQPAIVRSCRQVESL